MYKRIFDFFFSFFLLLFFSWLIVILWVISSLLFLKNGFFLQSRVGKNNKQFKIVKIRSMKHSKASINSYGRFIRKYKLDEIPQLFNIILGDMTFVGPRPELPSFFEKNTYALIFVTLKPGITSLASVIFLEEEKILSSQMSYRKKEIIEQWSFKYKNKLNVIYLKNKSFCLDLYTIYLTLKKIILLPRSSYKH